MLLSAMPESNENRPPDKFLDTDFANAGINFTKHIATLASASILVLATSFDKFPHGTLTIVVIPLAIAALSVSLLFSCLTMMAFMAYGASFENRSPKKVLELKSFL